MQKNLFPSSQRAYKFVLALIQVCKHSVPSIWLWCMARMELFWISQMMSRPSWAPDSRMFASEGWGSSTYTSSYEYKQTKKGSQAYEIPVLWRSLGVQFSVEDSAHYPESRKNLFVFIRYILKFIFDHW